MHNQKFRKLDVWKRSMDFISVIYKLTIKFPPNETYGLVSQIRRAAISISLNIAEGSGSRSDIEFNRFLNIALRSSYEVNCAIEIAGRLNYFSHDDIGYLSNECDEIAAMISGLSKYLK